MGMRLLLRSLPKPCAAKRARKPAAGPCKATASSRKLQEAPGSITAPGRRMAAVGTPKPPIDRELVHPETRGAWRAWLERNHGSSPGVWLVSWKKHTRRPAIPYGEAVEEALCFGWVDSRAGTLDADRSMQLYTPRRRGSGWSRPNKERVDRLQAAGLMAPAGLAVVDAARREGSWSLLDDAESLVLPDDLLEAFERHPGSRGRWDAFPPSSRRAILQWIALAKRADTRARRLEETARKAAAGERAIGQPAAKRQRGATP